MTRARVTLFVLVCVLVSPLLTGIGGGAAPSSAGPSTAEPAVSVDVTGHGSDSRTRYTIVISDSENVEGVALVVGTDGRVVETDGLTVTRAGNSTRLTATGESERLRVVVEAVDGNGSGAALGESFEGNGWRLGRVPFVRLRWRASDAGTVHTVRPLGDGFGALADDSSGTYGDRYALLGPANERTRTVEGREIRLVTPTGTDVTAGRGEILDALVAADRQLRVGDRGDVLLFALPEPARRGGESYPVRDEGWVGAGEPLDSANSVWLHEYVHTRQDFRLSREMAWFREASAEYYAARLATEQGRIDEATMHDHLDGRGREAALTDPSTWPDERVAYTKGARVLALLDRTIRETTDGERSLEDVFRRLNAHEGQVGYADFRQVVSEVAGHPMDGWLDRYVDGPTPVAGFYDAEEANTGLLDIFAAGASGTEDGLVVALVTTLSTLAASVPLYVYLRRVDPAAFAEQTGG